jgi:hypothetical protein
VGKNLQISLFATSGRTVYATKMKIVAMKFTIPLPGISQLSGGVYYVKMTGGKDFNYYGQVSITQ